MRLTLARLVAAAALVAATGLVLPATPAQAAACSTAAGVTVVVDFHELGGGVQQVCDAGGAGDDAATQFEDSGFSLTRVQRQPGFVCRVNNAPSSDQEACVNTPPADAYWGLWWSDGTSGEWTYASQGVDSLTVPEGGYVALSWNGSSTKSPPGATPTAHPTASPSPSSTPSPSPTHQPTHAPSQHPTTGTPTAGTSATGGPGSGGVSPSPSATSAGPTHRGKHRDRHRGTHRASPSAGPSSSAPATTDSSGPATATASDVPAADAPTPDDGGLPAWVAPAAVVALFAAAGATALVRRRRAG